MKSSSNTKCAQICQLKNIELLLNSKLCRLSPNYKTDLEHVVNSPCWNVQPCLYPFMLNNYNILEKHNSKILIQENKPQQILLMLIHIEQQLVVNTSC